MKWQLQRIVVTGSGVYRPSLPLAVEVAMVVVALLVIAIAYAMGRLAAVTMLLEVAVLGVLVVVRAWQYRRYGRLGSPSVAVDGGTLVFARPGDSRRPLHIALADVQMLIIYGRDGHRIYRFVRRDGSQFEAIPAWGPAVEAHVVLFLQQRLPPVVPVSVEEEQTLFASIRGDGPQQP